MKSFLHVWLITIICPRRGYALLLEKPAPYWGLHSILIRFIGTAITSILALHLLGRRPFFPSYLNFLDESTYYRAEIFFLPLFGIAAWLLSSALIYLLLRLMRIESEIDWVMNVIGFSLLVVMPLVWVIDWTSIALNVYGASFTIPIHALVSVWEIALISIGFKKIMGVSWMAAILFGFIVKACVFIPLAAIFVR